MKKSVVQWNIRMPKQLFDAIEDAHAKFVNEEDINVSFNAFIVRLLERATREEK